MAALTVYEVFQSSGVPKHTRVDVDEHNNKILSFLSTPGEHLIIHGPSKTGKSTLWISQIGEKNVIKIPCNEKTTLQGIFAEIADELDVYFTQSKVVSSAVKAGFESEIKGKIFGVFETGTKGKYDRERGSVDQQDRVSSPTLGVRNIAKYLKAAQKFIVIENIHYCSPEFRRDIAKDLHNFSDFDSKWIIVGVQHQADQVFIENRDLVGRLREIRSGVFAKERVNEILDAGGRLLNVEFDREIRDRIFIESGGNAALVQDIARNVCIANGVYGTQSTLVQISDINSVSKACTEIASSCAQVYSKFCDDIAKGGRSDGSTQKYKWFLRLVRDRIIPTEGLLNTEVYRAILELGHDDISQTSVTQGLQYMNKLQQKRNITPPVLEYDEDKFRLFLLDPYFRFCLRWIPNLIEKD